MNSTFTRWRKSRASMGEDHCVEVALQASNPTVGVRDTKDRQAGMIDVPTGSWASFITMATATV